MITIYDFKKVFLRVARVKSAEPVPKSEKLLRLVVEVGSEERQVIAGIAKQYAPADLVGKLVVVVTNLQPAKIMGQESKGMLLAANADDGTLKILTVEGDIAAGAHVR